MQLVAHGALAVLLVLGVAQPGAAQTYPEKAVRFVVPLAPGGTLDLVTRAAAHHVGLAFGFQSIVENRPGAASTIAAQYVARAAADGYTVLGIANTFATAPSILPAAGYDPVKDFVGLSLTASVPQIVVVSAALPARSIKDLVALAKARPGEMTYASAGTGSTTHIATELFARQAGIRLVHIPYKSNVIGIVDVISGQVAMLFDQIGSAAPYIASGKVRALAVTTRKRAALYPDLPTIEESGYPGYEAITYNGLVVHVGTPRERLALLHAAVVKMVQSRDVQKAFSQRGIELVASPTPEEFTAFLRGEVAKTAKLVRDAGIKGE